MITNEKMNKELYEALAGLDDPRLIEIFLDDLCTIKEVEAMAQRLAAAKLLLEGKTYNEVIEQTNISSATLSRISRCIQYGPGGYKSVYKDKK